MASINQHATGTRPILPDIPRLLTSASTNTLLSALSKSTEEHVQYLHAIGLSDRAIMAITSLVAETPPAPHISDHPRNYLPSSPIPLPLPLPLSLQNFHPHEKNTLITTVPGPTNRERDIQLLLDIRLYPALAALLHHLPLEIYREHMDTMIDTYRKRGWKPICRFTVPSAVTYYLMQSESEGSSRYMMIMAGLCGEENILAQLLTLKLANVNLEGIMVYGPPNFYSQLAEHEAEDAITSMPALSTLPCIILIASCGTEEMLERVVLSKQTPWNTQFSKQTFEGSILKLISYTYIPEINAAHKPSTNIVILSRVYGDTMEYVLRALLARTRCTHLFSGGAGGYIPSSSQPRNEWPPIGTFMPIQQSIFPSRQQVTIPPPSAFANLNLNLNLNFPKLDIYPGTSTSIRKDARPHLHISAVLLETYTWLTAWQDTGSTVDIETAHILNAIAKYHAEENASGAKHSCVGAPTALCGIFVSDYVGVEPLRSYGGVYEQHDGVVGPFLDGAII
ncbi:hypothetical protein SBOR_8509 [Sclerotinia borealis F-4128]|uniref:Uncharacterized protein n=1 Tax=Sclerotinia borealis (strain F-4128) TaxID=1432307 RepID=W9C8B6_SCLBF|nr:hypothetical protein SBOR_8509 [Sclerotinia borealis F-4128]